MNGVVANVLNSVLGNWIDNINSDQLKISVFSGEVLLECLSIKESAIESLGLPLKLVYGSIDKLSVKIPWSSLGSSPLKIQICGIHVLISPESPDTWSEQKEVNNVQIYKQALLDNYEAIQSSEIPVNQDKGFMSKLVTKIIQNVQVSIESLYIRYEDFISGTEAFCAGVVVKELKAVTCNRLWEPEFVEDLNLNYKLVELSQFRVFMDFGETMLLNSAEIGFKKVVIEELKEIYDHKYLLKPTTFTIKVEINSNPQDLSAPQYSVHINNSSVCVSIESQQILHIFNALDFLKDYQSFKNGIKNTLVYPDLEGEDVEAYRELYKIYRLTDKKTQEKAFLIDFEKKYNVYSLISHRKNIDKELELLKKEQELLGDIKKIELEGMGGTMSKLTGIFWGKSESQKKLDEEARTKKIELMKSQLEMLVKERKAIFNDMNTLIGDFQEFDKVPKEFVRYLIGFQVEFTEFCIKHQSSDLVVFEMNKFFIELGMRSSSVYGKFHLQNVFIKEYITKSTYFPYILQQEYIEIQYESLLTTEIKVKSGDLSIIGNFESIFKVYSIFTQIFNDSSDNIKSIYLESISATTMQYMEYGEKAMKDFMKAGTQSSFKLNLDLKAPLICVPLDIHKIESGMLIVDLGSLACTTGSETQMTCTFDIYSFILRDVRLCVVWSCSGYRLWRDGLRSEVLTPINFVFDIKNCKEIQYEIPSIQVISKLSPMGIIVNDEVFVFILILKEYVFSLVPKTKPKENLSPKAKAEPKVTEAYKDRMKRIEQIIAVKIYFELDEVSIKLNEKGLDLAEIQIYSVKAAANLGKEGDFKSEFSLARLDLKDLREDVKLFKVVSNPMLENNEFQEFYDAQEEILQIKAKVVLKPKSDVLDIGIYINDMRLIATSEFLNTITQFFSSPFKKASVLSRVQSSIIQKVPVSEYTTTLNTRIVLQLTNFELWLPLSTKNLNRRAGCFYLGSYVEYRSSKTYTSYFDIDNNEVSRDIKAISDEASIEITNIGGIVGVINNNRVVLSEERTYDLLPPSRIGVYYVCNKLQYEPILTKFNINLESIQFEIGFRDIQYFKNLLDYWKGSEAPISDVPSVPEVRNSMNLQLDCDSFKLTLLEDTGVKAYDLLHFHVSSLKLGVSLHPDKMQASLSAFIFSDYYNLKISAWEPMIENWNFDAALIKASNTTPANVEIDSPTMLDINLTMSMVETLGTLINKLGQDSSFWTENSAKEKALTDQNELLAHGQFFYNIENNLGTLVQAWLDIPNIDVETWILPHGQSQMFTYQQLQEKIGSSGLKKGLSNGITEEVQTPVKLCLKVDGYDIVRGLHFESLGVKGFRLCSPDKKIVCILNVTAKENLRIIRIETGKGCMNNIGCPLILKCGNNEHELDPGTYWALPIKWIFSTEKTTVLAKGEDSLLFENKAIELITGDWSVQIVSEYKTETPYRQLIAQFNHPYSFENLLPGLMTIYSDKSDNPIGCINSGSPLYSTKLNPNTSHDFKFKIEFESGQSLSTNWVQLKSKNKSLPVTGTFPAKTISMSSSVSDFKKCKNLDLSYRKKCKESDDNSMVSKTIEVYSPYCIVNKTDMELELIDKKTGVVCCPHSIGFFKSNKLKLKLTSEEFGEPSEVTKDFNIESIGVSGCISLKLKNSDDNTPKEILLGINVVNSTVPLVKSKIVYITPRFILCNNLGYPLHIRQYFKDGSGKKVVTIEDSKNSPFNLENLSQGRLIQVSCDNENWSSAFSIQNIEDFQIKFLGCKSEKEVSNDWNKPNKLNGYNHIIRVIVSTDDQASIHTSFTIPKDPEFIINNTTLEEFTIRQLSFREVVVPPSSKVPWAFDDLNSDKTLELRINGKTKEINIEKVKRSKKFSKYRLEVRVIGVTRELTITLTRGSIDSDLDTEENSRVMWKIDIHFRGLGLSIIDDKPSELFYFSAIEINSLIKLREKQDAKRIEHSTKFRLRVGKIQIDNMKVKGKLFPVVFGPSTKQTDESIPMLQLEVDKTSYKSLIKDSKLEKTSIDRFSWVEISMQEMKLSINQEIITMMLNLSRKIISSLFLNTSFKSLPLKPVPITSICGLLDPCECKLKSYSSHATTKSYFKILRLCAIKVLVSFKTSTKKVDIGIDPREGFGIVQLLGAIGGAFVNISDSPLYFKEVIIQESFQTGYTLLWQIISNYQRQGVLQFYKILGSADLLGNPVGLIDKLGTGVLEFINEPVKGVIKGPKAFAEGVKKGMRSLVGNVIAGGFGSISKITGNLYGLVREVGGDVNGADRINDSDNTFENIYQGLKGGFIDLAEGVTGVFLKPWKGAKKEGAKGLFKGIGSGILGIVTSPLSAALRIGSGISTGVTNAATFLAKGKVTPLGRSRFPRHFSPRKVLESYNFEIAEAQDYLRNLPDHKKEQIVFYIRLEEEESLIIIVTLKSFLFIVNTDLIQEYDLDKITSLEVHMAHNENFYLRIACDNNDSLVISSQNYGPLIKLYSAISSLTNPSKPQKGVKKIQAPSRYGSTCCRPKKKDRTVSKYALKKA